MTTITRDATRTERMAEMYRQGVTLEKIGEQFGVSRQRVHILLQKAGVDPKAGGQALQTRIKREHQQPKPHVWSQRLGVSRETYEMAAAAGLILAYRNHKNSAACRGIKFALSFGQWLAVWQTSGKLDRRGRGKGHYCMSRIKDSGGYELGNVHIQPCDENSREAVSKWAGKTKAIRGVFCLYPGTPRPWIAKVGKHQVGRFETMEEAGAARDEYLAANPPMMLRPGPSFGRGKGWSLKPRCKSKPYQVRVAGTKNTYHATAEEARAEYLRRCAEVAEQRRAQAATPTKAAA